MKKIALLGATGSIGDSTLEVIRAHPDKFQLVLLVAHNSYDLLIEIAREFNVPAVVVTNRELEKQNKEIPNGVKFYFGDDELFHLLNEIEIDIVVNAIAGSAGLRSTMVTISRGIDLALANKESLVMAGHLVKTELLKSTSRMIPVDSEHSAVFQCIGQSPHNEIERIILTASGGPFRNKSLTDFADITLADTLKHPTWNMGTKITVDSATMMNKGLEVIEAHWLFDMPYNKIDAVIHPQSIIHSMVEFLDGSTLAQMGFPTMQLPILYALTYPKHIKSEIARTDILKLGSLNFDYIEKERYPLYYLGLEVGKQGGLLPTIMNSVNEAAIRLFVEGKIRYIDIFSIIEKSVAKAHNIDHPDLETIIANNELYYKQILRNYK